MPTVVACDYPQEFHWGNYRHFSHSSIDSIPWIKSDNTPSLVILSASFGRIAAIALFIDEILPMLTNCKGALSDSGFDCPHPCVAPGQTANQTHVRAYPFRPCCC